MEKLRKISNQYVIVNKIGEGGFATVYKAADVALRKFVAVKRIKKEYTKNKKIVDMFRSEAVNTAKLEHENIVKVINFIKEEENYFIILDYVKGVDLEYLIMKNARNKRIMPSSLAAYIMLQTLKALDYAHTFKDELTGKEMNFVHYDVSPGNIMLYYNGRIKLTDFGIAKAGKAAQKGIRGKISYVSPEQVKGEEAGPLSDLFSAGLVFYEALTGRKAYKGSISAKLRQAKSAKVDLGVLKKKRKTPKQLIKIAEKLLKKDPGKRYQSARECISDLEAYLSNKKGIYEWESTYKKYLEKRLKAEISKAEEELKREAETDFSWLREEGKPIRKKRKPESQIVKEGEKTAESEETDKPPEYGEISEKDVKKKKKKPEDKAEGSKKKDEDSAAEFRKKLKKAKKKREKKKKKPEKPEGSKKKDEDSAAEFRKKLKEAKKKREKEKKKPEDKAEGSKKKDEDSAAEFRKKLKEAKEKREKEKKDEDSAAEFRKKLKRVKKSAKKKTGYSKGEDKKKKKINGRSKKRDKTVAPETKQLRKKSFSEEEKEKTVIDFVLDTAKRYRKIFVSVVFSLIFAALIFSAIDTFIHMTPVGLKIHNFIWPPAISIDTFPSGARIRIYDEDDVDIIEEGGYRRTTPSYVEKISPGTYTLELSKDDYGEMSRVITVLEDSAGEKRVTIADARREGDMYIVPFQVRVDVDSVPPDSVLLINGINVGSTPFTGDLEIGKHSLQLVKEGYEVLGLQQIPEQKETGVCVIDTSKPASRQDMVDENFWEIGDERLPDRKKKLNVTGSLWKYVTIESEPDGVDVKLKNKDTEEIRELGETPLRDLKIGFGEYVLEARRDGYKTTEKTLTVDAELEEVKNIQLKRYVNIRAFQEGTDRELNADVVMSNPRIDTIRGRTPIEAALPLENVDFSVRREPSYHPVNVRRDVADLDDTYIVEMRLRAPHLTVNVSDYVTGEGIGSAEVLINGELWKETDSSGRARGFIEKRPGEYEIEVKSDKYEDERHRGRVEIYRGQRREHDVRFGAPRDGTVWLKLPSGYSIDSVYINEEEVGIADGNIISGVSRGAHNIRVDLFDGRGLEGEFNLTEPDQVVMLKAPEDEDTLNLHSPPVLSVVVKDYATGDAPSGAEILINGETIGETGDDGRLSASILKPDGYYVITARGAGTPEALSAVELQKDREKEIDIKINSPEDGTIIIDAEDGIDDARVYINEVFRGQNASLLSDIARTRNLVRISSENLQDEVSEIIEITGRRSLVVLRLKATPEGMTLEEIDPRGYLH